MTQEELKKYKGKKAIAVYTLSNFGGVEIIDVVYGINDGVVYRYYDEPLAYSELECDYDGRTYFRVGNYEIYLDECMRVFDERVGDLRYEGEEI